MSKFVAMWNLPGCLPEMEPAHFDTFEEARDFIADELQGAADDALLCALDTDVMTQSDIDAPAWERAERRARTSRGVFAIGPCPDGYVYSVEAVAP